MVTWSRIISGISYQKPSLHPYRWLLYGWIHEHAQCFQMTSHPPGVNNPLLMHRAFITSITRTAACLAGNWKYADRFRLFSWVNVSGWGGEGAKSRLPSESLIHTWESFADKFSFLLLPPPRFFILLLLATNMNRNTYLKVGCLHPVACTRSGSGFSSNSTLVWIFYSITTKRWS
jgi:hypothetical protein